MSEEQGLGWRRVLGLGVLVAAFHYLALALLPFVAAGIVAFLVEPAVVMLRRRAGWPHWAAAAAVFVVLVAAGGGLLAATVVSGLPGARKLASDEPRLLHDLARSLVGPDGLNALGTHVSPDQLALEIQRRLQALPSIDILSNGAPLLLGAAAGAVLFLFLSFYLILSGPELARGALNLLPADIRKEFEARRSEVVSMLRRFYGGVLAIVSFTAVVAWIGYGLLLHVQGAIVLSVVLGLLETLPAVGPLISAVVVALVALQLGSGGAMALMIGYAVALRLAVDNVLAPFVLGGRRSCTLCW